MRRAVAPAIPSKAYRHFAIVTLAVTAGLAMFADGEGREARGVQSAGSSPAVVSAPATFATSSTTEEEAFDGWEGDGESDDGFGSGIEAGIDGADSSTITDLDDLKAPGYSADYLASLGVAERELLLQGLRENGMLTPEISERRSTALRGASERRSGPPSDDV